MSPFNIGNYLEVKICFQLFFINTDNILANILKNSINMWIYSTVVNGNYIKIISTPIFTYFY